MNHVNSRSIALIELAMHNEVLLNYIRIFMANGYRVKVYTNQFNQQQLSTFKLDVDFTIMREEESVPRFMDRIKEELDLANINLFITIDQFFKFFRDYRTSAKKLLVVHKLNMFVNPTKRFYPRNGFFQTIRDISWIIRFHLRQQGRLYIDFLQSFDELIFPSETVASYCDEQGWSAFLPPYTTIDFALHEVLVDRPRYEDYVRITIPGIISDKSRDYEIIMELLKRLNPERPTRFCFLGQAKGRRGAQIIKQLNEISHPLIVIESFRGFIDQEVFDELLKDSHFLILPIARYMQVGVFKELNGFTCVSGNINDMLRFGIPALIPSYYPLKLGLDMLATYYENLEDLIPLVEKWIQQSPNIGLKKDLSKSLELFTAKKALSKPL